MTYILSPVDTGERHYRWPGLTVNVSACDTGSRTNRGVFASTLLRCGTRFPVLGFDRTYVSRHRSNYTFRLTNGQYLDGDPRLDPFDGIGARGLAIAMQINEPPVHATNAPNVVVRGHWVVCVRDILPGQELFLYYGASYIRESTQTELTGYISVVPYHTNTRAATYQISNTTQTLIEQRRPSNAVLHDTYQQMYRLVPRDSHVLGMWYVPGRRTGLGYDFNVNDPAPKLVLGLTTWITAEREPDIQKRRGLFVGAGHQLHKGDTITTYSGYIVKQRGVAGAYLATVLRQTFAIDGFRLPVSEHGMAQFVNDLHQSPRTTPNAELRMGLDFERVLVATEDIGPGVEILLSAPDHRRAFLTEQPSFVVNRLRTCANNELCVIRYRYADQTVEPVVCHLSNIQANTATARWYAATDEYKTIGELLTLPFLPGWENDNEEIVFSQISPQPASVWKPYVNTRFELRTSEILVHAVQLHPVQQTLHADLRRYLCPRFGQ